MPPGTVYEYPDRHSHTITHSARFKVYTEQDYSDDDNDHDDYEEDRKRSPKA